MHTCVKRVKSDISSPNSICPLNKGNTNDIKKFVPGKLFSYHTLKELEKYRVT